MSGRFKIKKTEKPMPVAVTSQQRYKNVCMVFIDKITSATGIDRGEFLEFLKFMRVNLHSNYAKKFLIIVSTSDKEAILDAYYTYVNDRDKYEHNNVNVNIKRFLRYLINSKNKTISIEDEFKITDGVYDSVDDEISFDELNRSIGFLENECE